MRTGVCRGVCVCVCARARQTDSLSLSLSWKELRRERLWRIPSRHSSLAKMKQDNPEKTNIISRNESTLIRQWSFIQLSVHPSIWWTWVRGKWPRPGVNQRPPAYSHGASQALSLTSLATWLSWLITPKLPFPWHYILCWRSGWVVVGGCISTKLDHAIRFQIRIQLRRNI